MFQVASLRLIKLLFPRVVCLKATAPYCVQPGEKRAGSILSSRECRQPTENAPIIEKLPFQRYSDDIVRTGISVTNACENNVLSLIDSVPVPSASGVFTIGDYGTSDGAVSQQLIHKIIERLRKKHGQDLNIQVLYEDQPSNDFNSLFKRVYEKTSYLSHFSKVFPLACGTSFYEQCVPEKSCDLIIATLASHWLSTDNFVRSSNSIFPWLSTSREELGAYKETCQYNWEQFLHFRARELKLGGVLFVAQTLRPTGKQSQPDSGHRETGTHDTLVDLDLSWKTLYTEGLITEEEFQACTIQMAMPSLQEIKAPFDGLKSRVRPLGLSFLQEPEQLIVPSTAISLWRKKIKTDGGDDRGCFADLLTKETRFWSERTFRNSLVNTRSADEQSAIINRLYHTFHSKVAAKDPENYQSDWVLCTLAAQKCNQTCQ
ncbi:gibberellic acid methyltransferase 2-like [Pomacea canaliculata]|uniref:gibberellic acid methyltransferase 2-like n=1 Tax=Pomacea canaliculata TaxID=400727 RepID=UPI000D73C6E4|nr:gibberellic acid methyltransferase 2-like [Pomacea canaliculata]